MKTVSQVIEQIETSKKSAEFMATGLTMLDEALDGGFMRKELIVLGGSTGIGKSYLAGQLFWNIAKKGYPSAYFSLEISNEMVVARLLGALANIKSSRVMSVALEVYEEKAKDQARLKVIPYEQFMHFYDDVYIFEDIKNKIIANKYEFIVVDFIQNVMIPKVEEYERLSTVALGLQKLAKQVNCCILVLSQLSNSVARAGDGSILEYKGSGSIATVCDLGFFIMRGDAELGLSNQITLLLRKNRRGPSGLSFNFSFQAPGGLII